jgi:hypothetical protein
MSSSSEDSLPAHGATGSWFTKATGLCEQIEVELVQQKIAALSLQLEDSEVRQHLFAT